MALEATGAIELMALILALPPAALAVWSLWSLTRYRSVPRSDLGGFPTDASDHVLITSFRSW